MGWGALLGFRRLGRGVLVSGAALGAVMALGSPATAAPATGATAVVLVSGFTTTTPFTTPRAQCRGTYARGLTWTYDGGRYAAAGYNVYTAPVNDGAGAVIPDPPLFSGCAAQLPASMTINSRGDIYANARALASFVAYLHSRYRVSSARIVAHSYGGLWTRGALRLASGSFPGVRVLSITTLGTPHLGSFLADIGEGVDPSFCGLDIACRVIADLLVAYREAKFEPALSQVTAASLEQWNPGQGQSLKGIPLTAISGNAIRLPGISNPYISPDDVLIGLQSAQAVGLDKAGVIPELACFSPFPDVHSNTFLPFFPAVKHSLLSDPGIVADVEQTLAGQPPSSRCPNPASAGTRTTSTLVSGASSRTLTLPLRAASARLGTTLPRASSGDAIIFLRGTLLTCRGRPLGSIPFLNSIQLRVIPQPSCSGRLRVTPGGAGALYLRHTADSVTIRIHSGRLFVHVRGPGSARRPVVAIKQGRRFLTRSLDREHSLRVARGPRIITLRIELAQPGGARELAIATLHL